MWNDTWVYRSDQLKSLQPGHMQQLENLLLEWGSYKSAKGSQLVSDFFFIFFFFNYFIIILSFAAGLGLRTIVSRQNKCIQGALGSIHFTYQQIFGRTTKR